MQSTNRESGFTIVEMTIAIVLLLVLAAVTSRVVVSTSDTTEITISRSGLQTRAYRVLDQIIGRVRAAGLETVENDLSQGIGGSTIRYRVPTFVDGDDIIWSSVFEIALVPDPDDPPDGDDNDGDSLVDECQIVFRTDVGGPDETTVVWASGVAAILGTEQANGNDDNGNELVDELGLAFELSGKLLRVWVTLEGQGESGTLTATASTAVMLRN